MDARDIKDLPLFDEFARTAADDEAFERVWKGGLSDLPDDPIFMVSHAMTRNTLLHTHGYYELSYIMDGRVENVVDGNELFLLPDSLCLMCPESSHALAVVDHEAIVVNLCLRPELFREGVFRDFLSEDAPLSRTMRGDEGRGFMVFSDAYGRILKRSMIALLKEYDHAGHTANYAVVARTLLLLAQLSEIDTYSFYGIDRAMMEVFSYVDEHAGEVSVASLARHFGYNETYFSHMVRRKVGLRVRELIVAARMRRARELLAEGELSVQAIAEAVGYSSYSHFNRVFREKLSITPAAYRAYAAGERGGVRG